MLTKRQRKVLSELPPASVRTVTVAYSGYVRARKAIAAKCLLCQNGNAHFIASCADETCPLILHRPFQAFKESHQ